MTMVERLARVICETQNVEGFKCTCPLAGEPKGNDWCNGNRAIAQARAAIEAMREPTEAMKRAWQGPLPWDQDALEVYQALIDAALSAPKLEGAAG